MVKHRPHFDSVLPFAPLAGGPVSIISGHYQRAQDDGAVQHRSFVHVGSGAVGTLQSAVPVQVGGAVQRGVLESDALHALLAMRPVIAAELHAQAGVHAL